MANVFHATHWVRPYVRNEGLQRVGRESLQSGRSLPLPIPSLASTQLRPIASALPTARGTGRPAEGTGTPPPQRWCHSEGLGDVHREQLHMPALARTVNPLTPFLLIATKDS